MRVGPSSTVLASASSWGCRVVSWLGAVVLADDIPATGRATVNTQQQVPEHLELTVPRFSVVNNRTVDWLPADPRSPLARFGQQLDVTVIADGVETRIGRYLITDWEDAGDTVRVTGEGVLQSAVEDRLTTPTAPRDDGTLKSEFLRLLPPYMTARFDDALVDRPVPRAMEWDEDRLAALFEIADAWPARVRTDPWGQVLVLPPLPSDAVPVVSITDGEGGTLVGAPISDTRASAYNMVVARSSQDGVSAQAVARVLSGPMKPDGDYRPVPKFYSSPLLDDEAQCLSAAQKLLADAVRPSRVLRVEMAPDPRVQEDDPVEIITGKGTRREERFWGFVIGNDLPLTPSDGAQRLDVAIF
jgi:hypothetical protein